MFHSFMFSQAAVTVFPWPSFLYLFNFFLDGCPASSLGTVLTRAFTNHVPTCSMLTFAFSARYILSWGFGYGWSRCSFNQVSKSERASVDKFLLVSNRCVSQEFVVVALDLISWTNNASRCSSALNRIMDALRRREVPVSPDDKSSIALFVCLLSFGCLRLTLVDPYEEEDDFLRDEVLSCLGRGSVIDIDCGVT